MKWPDTYKIRHLFSDTSYVSDTHYVDFFVYAAAVNVYFHSRVYEVEEFPEWLELQYRDQRLVFFKDHLVSVSTSATRTAVYHYTAAELGTL